MRVTKGVKILQENYYWVICSKLLHHITEEMEAQLLQERAAQADTVLVISDFNYFYVDWAYCSASTTWRRKSFNLLLDNFICHFLETSTISNPPLDLLSSNNAK